MKHFHLCIWVLWLVPNAVYAQHDCTLPSGGGVGSEGVHGININVPAGFDPAPVQAAAAQWNGCNDPYIPRITVNQANSAGIEIDLVVSTLPASSVVGRFRLLESQIIIHTTTSGGDPFTPGQYTTILAHELGHALGLDDVGNNTCLMGGYTGQSKEVSDTECAYVASGWYDRFQNHTCDPKRAPEPLFFGVAEE